MCKEGRRGAILKQVRHPVLTYRSLPSRPRKCVNLRLEILVVFSLPSDSPCAILSGLVPGRMQHAHLASLIQSRGWESRDATYRESRDAKKARDFCVSLAGCLVHTCDTKTVFESFIFAAIRRRSAWPDNRACYHPYQENTKSSSFLCVGFVDLERRLFHLVRRIVSGLKNLEKSSHRLSSIESRGRSKCLRVRESPREKSENTWNFFTSRVLLAWYRDFVSLTTCRVRLRDDQCDRPVGLKRPTPWHYHLRGA